MQVLGYWHCYTVVNYIFDHFEVNDNVALTN